MKKLLSLILLFFITTLGFAGDGIILHPSLAYKTDNQEAKNVGFHTLGDSIKVIGEEKKVGKNPYRSINISDDDTSYISSAYYVIDNSIQGVITSPAYLYKYNDLSSITNSKINILTFVAVQNYNPSETLTKVSYLLWSVKGKYWYVSDGWVKTSFISTKKDDWGSAVKYFLAKQEETTELQLKKIKAIAKLNKSSVFIPLINKMVETGEFSIKVDIELDPLFGGTNTELINKHDITIYEYPDVNSNVLLSGFYNVKLNSKSMETIDLDGTSDYMYNVTVGDITGWVHGLK